ncbi:MAG: class I SAM-dependent methyltransferase [Ktedonobacteraceae bacterium]|nr:class I SAM-dependent methyltransferase [Ktedonobacteraceae bacterium]
MQGEISEKRDISVQATVTGAGLRFLQRLLQRETGMLLPPVMPLHGLKRVLDAFCGPGAWAIDLARAYPHLQVTGVDQRLALLRLARADARAGGIQNLRFDGVSTMERLPYASDYFDCIHAWCDDALAIVHDRTGVLREFWRILRPGGWIQLRIFDVGASSSPALNCLCEYMRASTEASHSPSLLYPGLLAEAGYTRIRYTLHPIDLGNQRYDHGRKYARTVLLHDQCISQLIEQAGSGQGRELAEMITEVRKETACLDYCAIGMLTNITASKP